MIERPSPSFWQRLGQIPRVYIYLLLAGVVVWQLVWPIHLPIAPSQQTKGVYEAIQAVPDDKLIILGTDWDASTQPETGPQTEAIMRAILQQKKHFVMLNLSTPAGVKLANDIAVKVAKDYGAQEGVDWANWGFKYGLNNIIIGLAKDIRATIKTDRNNTPIEKQPITAHVRDHRDIGLVIEISGAEMTGYWIQFLQGAYGTPLANAVTAVMAPGYYPFLDSKQLQGMLVGAKGAAEMESLVHHPGLGSAIM